MNETKGTFYWDDWDEWDLDRFIDRTAAAVEEYLGKYVMFEDYYVWSRDGRL